MSYWANGCNIIQLNLCTLTNFDALAPLIFLRKNFQLNLGLTSDENIDLPKQQIPLFLPCSAYVFWNYKYKKPPNSRPITAKTVMYFLFTNKTLKAHESQTLPQEGKHITPHIHIYSRGLAIIDELVNFQSRSLRK